MEQDSSSKQNSFNRAKRSRLDNSITQSKILTSSFGLDSNENSLTPVEKKRKFFNVHKLNNVLQSSNFKIKLEIEQYLNLNLNEEYDCLNFWQANHKTFPYLSELALKYLSVPSTTSPVERLFSQSGYILRPHRSKMTELNLEKTVLMHCNALF